MLDILVINCSSLKKEKIKCHHQKFILFYFFKICTFDGGYSVFRLEKLYEGKCVSVTTLCDHKTIF